MRRLNILVLHGMGSKKKWFSGVADVELIFPNNDNINNYLIHNCYLPVPDCIKKFNFDAILLMSTFIDHVAQYGLNSRWLAQYDFIKNEACVKIAFPQDDYWCSEIKDFFYVKFKINKVYPVCSEKYWSELIPKYLNSNNSVEIGYTTYITEKSIGLCGLEVYWNERKYDFVYRARKIPNAPNKYGHIKGVIGDRFLKSIEHYPELICDISTNPSRIICGDEWYKFLANSKATLGSNSGSSVLLRNNEVKDRLVSYLRLNPKVDSFTVEASVFQEEDRNKSYTAISPRNVEAAMLGVLQVLTPGEYGGFLEPNEDYLLLEENCSNIDEVIKYFRNSELCLSIINNCRKKLLSNDELSAKKFISKNISFIQTIRDKRLTNDFENSFSELAFQYAQYERLMCFVVDAYYRSRHSVIKYIPNFFIKLLKKTWG